MSDTTSKGIAALIVFILMIPIFLIYIYAALIIGAYVTTFVTWTLGQNLSLSIIGILTMPFQDVFNIAIANWMYYAVVFIILILALFSRGRKSKKEEKVIIQKCSCESNEDKLKEE